jgi:hypothetical protein
MINSYDVKILVYWKCYKLKLESSIVMCNKDSRYKFTKINIICINISSLVKISINIMQLEGTPSGTL